MKLSSVIRTEAFRRALATIMLCGCVLPSITGAVDSTTDIAQVVDAIYAGALGAVSGDVNADGAGSAADLTGVVSGLRSPTWTGPYRVGVTILSFTKQSVTTGDPRQLDTVIWYPTNATGPVSITLGGIRDAPVATDLGPLPLLIFSHGSCGYPTQSLFLTPLWASYGLVVASPPHPGNMLTDGPSCGSGATLVDSFANRLPDVMFVIDSMLAENETASSRFFGALDPARIGMSGHSFGGQTTLRVAAADPRVIAGLALAPAMFSIADVPAQIHVPMMIQDGEIDTVTPFMTNALVAFNGVAPPRYLVEIFNTGHYAFSDGCFPGPDCAPGTLKQDEAHLYVLRFAVPFVLNRVAGDGRYDAFLDPAGEPPGVAFTADPGS